MTSGTREPHTSTRASHAAPEAPGAEIPPPAVRESTVPPPIWTRTFNLLAATQVLGYLHQGMLIPIIPLYLVFLGYSEVTVGVVIAAYATTGFTIRPFLGYLADTWSVRGVVGLGGLLLGIPAAVLMLPSLWLIGLANTVRGIGWSSFSTGGSTLMAHIAPPTRRGEATSYISLFQNGMLSLAPPFALWLLTLGGAEQNFAAVFLVASAAGLLLAGLTFLMPRTVAPPKPSARAVVQERDSLVSRFYDRGVLLPSVLLVCLQLTSSAMTAFAPLYALQLGIAVESMAWYYITMGATSLLGRTLFGAVSDRLGRGPALAAGYACTILGLVFMSAASELILFLAAGAAFSIGQALHQPSAMALAIDRSDPERRGTSMASYSLWFQASSGFGALIAGTLAASTSYQAMYLVLVLFPLGGLVVVARQWRGLRPADTARTP